MKEVVLKLSEEDFDKIKKQIVCEGSVKDLRFDVVEAVVKDVPFNIEYIRGELL